MVFVHGNEATMCFLQIQGSLMYSQMEEKLVPPENAWISEMCLWMHWDYAGDLRCITFSKIYTLHADAFREIISSAVPLQVQAHVYATEYVKALRGRAVLSDLWQHDEAGDGLKGRKVSGSTLTWVRKPFKTIVPM